MQASVRLPIRFPDLGLVPEPSSSASEGHGDERGKDKEREKESGRIVVRDFNYLDEFGKGIARNIFGIY